MDPPAKLHARRSAGEPPYSPFDEHHREHGQGRPRDRRAVRLSHQPVSPPSGEQQPREGRYRQQAEQRSADIGGKGIHEPPTHKVRPGRCAAAGGAAMAEKHHECTRRQTQLLVRSVAVPVGFEHPHHEQRCRNAGRQKHGQQPLLARQPRRLGSIVGSHAHQRESRGKITGSPVPCKTDYSLIIAASRFARA